MLGKTPNKVYGPFLKAGLGYKEPERLKKAIAAQPKLYDGEKLHSAKLIIDSPDSEKILEDADETRLKIRNKMNLKELKDELIEEVQEMLNIFDSMEQKVNGKSPIENMLQNEIDRLLEKNKLLIAGLEKSSNDSKDIQANLLKRIKILENDFKRSQAQSIDFELKLQHQKEKMACDVSWKSKLSTINDENVLLKTQVDFVVKERENIKLKYQKLFNSIKATRTQHQKELDELIEHVNKKTYAYADVRAQNQDLLITISELKNKLKTVDNEKNVNSKFEKSETSGTLLCVTRLPKNIAVKAKKVSNSKVNADRLKPVALHLTPKNEQSQTQNENVIARGMYRITKTETQTPDSKTNINVSNSTGVESSNSVRRPKSKDTKSKNKVLKNTNAKSSNAHVCKMLRNASIDFNKRETMHSNVCQSNASVLSSKTVNAINDGSNIICVSCGKDVFLLSHEKCVACYALSMNSSVKRALFTTLIATKSKTLGATSIVAKSRLSVVKTPTATNRVFSVLPLSPNSSQSRTLIRFGNDHFAAITRYGDYVQGNLTICYVYYVEGLGHNLFSVGQFCDGDLEVAFHSNTCYVRNLEGDDLLIGSLDSNLYTIFISAMAASSPVCLMSRATSTKSWLWHHRLSHLNFGTINQLTSKDLVNGLLKFKYNKDHLRSACEQGIVHKTLTARTPQQNGVVERRNQTLVEATRTMLIFSKSLEFLSAEAIATACFTQNRSIVHTRYNKTPYELIRGRKPNIQHFHVFGYLCYLTNDRDDLGKMKPKADIGIFMVILSHQEDF
ncbi:retrovirus-related pol polyprotein from transposon TNT 1-94, partial [Tanacetum coccineum]